MTRVYLIRHGEAEGNIYRRAHGWYNGHITPKGRRQIAELAERFKNEHIDASGVLSSWDASETKRRRSSSVLCRRLAISLNSLVSSVSSSRPRGSRRYA